MADRYLGSISDGVVDILQGFHAGFMCASRGLLPLTGLPAYSHCNKRVLSYHCTISRGFCTIYNHQHAKHVQDMAHSTAHSTAFELHHHPIVTESHHVVTEALIVINRRNAHVRNRDKPKTEIEGFRRGLSD